MAMIMLNQVSVAKASFTLYNLFILPKRVVVGKYKVIGMCVFLKITFYSQSRTKALSLNSLETHEGSALHFTFQPAK